MLKHNDTTKLYKTQWMAYYKSNLKAPTIVYGESEAEAMNNALAEYRKGLTLVDLWPMDRVVKKVKYLG